MCATFDGELVAFGADGTPDFPLVCKRMRMRRRSIAVTYVMFDLLTLEGDSLLNERYSKRRAELEELRFERALERVVAKKSASRYTPGERGWVKTKNRKYGRYELERESATPRPR